MSRFHSEDDGLVSAASVQLLDALDAALNGSEKSVIGNLPNCCFKVTTRSALTFLLFLPCDCWFAH